MESAEVVSREFCRQLGTGLHLSELFDQLPEIYLYVKDLAGRFIKVNRPLLQLLGMDSERQIIGKTDFDFFPRHLAEQYVEEDRRVIQRRAAIPNQVWLVPAHDGQLKWFLSSKIPLFGQDRSAVGIAGVMRDLEQTDSVVRPYREFDGVIRHVLQHYHQRIDVRELAHKVHLSISQFDRRFKQLFQMTPQQYILRVRINAACQRLTSTAESAAQIAQHTGFYDQSYFTRQFHKHMGTTPLAYRKRYRR